MTKHYLEQVERVERQIALVEAGFCLETENVRQSIAKCDDAKRIIELIHSLDADINALNDLYSTHEYYLDKYREEVQKSSDEFDARVNG